MENIALAMSMHVVFKRVFNFELHEKNRMVRRELLFRILATKIGLFIGVSNDGNMKDSKLRTSSHHFLARIGNSSNLRFGDKKEAQKPEKDRKANGTKGGMSAHAADCSPNSPKTTTTTSSATTTASTSTKHDKLF